MLCGLTAAALREPPTGGPKHTLADSPIGRELIGWHELLSTSPLSAADAVDIPKLSPSAFISCFRFASALGRGTGPHSNDSTLRLMLSEGVKASDATLRKLARLLLDPLVMDNLAFEDVSARLSKLGLPPADLTAVVTHWLLDPSLPLLTVLSSPASAYSNAVVRLLRAGLSSDEPMLVLNAAEVVAQIRSCSDVVRALIACDFLVSCYDTGSVVGSTLKAQATMSAGNVKALQSQLRLALTLLALALKCGDAASVPQSLSVGDVDKVPCCFSAA